MLKSLLSPFKYPDPPVVQTTASGSRVVCEAAKKLIRSFEGMARRGPDGMIYPYWDVVGYPTIGIGHLLSRVKYEPLEKYSPITEEEAIAQFEEHVDKFSRQVASLFTCELSDNEFGALVSLAFNIGVGNLQGSSLRRKLNRGDSRAECGDEFLKWDKACGKKVPGLSRRRYAERSLFLS